MAPHPFLDKQTSGGYLVGECASALQKAIRRCEERHALWWATELDLAGYANYVWRRLRLICSEDVGLAEPDLPATIRALYDNWLESTKAKKEGDARLYLVHAVLLLARARKSRIVDNAANLYYGRQRDPARLEMPDWALDAHTARGRGLGRTERNCYESSYGVARQELYDPYLAPAHPWMDADRAERLAHPHAEHPTRDDEAVRLLD